MVRDPAYLLMAAGNRNSPKWEERVEWQLDQIRGALLVLVIVLVMVPLVLVIFGAMA